MSFFIRYVAAIVLTGVCYLLSDLTLYAQMEWWQPFVIGFIAVTAGMLTEKCKAPMFLIIALPFVVGTLLLFGFMDWQWEHWLATYLLTWLYYGLLHIVLSSTLKYDSLIPAWKLHK